MKKSICLVVFICFSLTINLFSQNEKEQKIERPFSFKEPFHSLGFSVFTGINFAPKLQDYLGEIEPVLFHSIVPEFILQYNFMIKNGFGVALEVPFGLFSRTSVTLLSDYGASNDVWLNMGDLYIGFSGKITVFKELHKNICMQGELGIKFNPFYHPANQWENREYNPYNPRDEYDIAEDNSSVNFTKVEQQYYGVPDATAAVLFFFHSQKKPRHNFILGLNVNLSFVKRIKVTYDTYFSELGLNNIPYSGFGNYGWNSTAIGITLGYRFFGVK